MSIAVKISDELVNKAKKTSHVMNRSVAGQIEYWAKMGYHQDKCSPALGTLHQKEFIGKKE